MSGEQCQACGSSLADRERYAAQHQDDEIPLGFTTCPHCSSAKCCMCDMGDDVECLSCGEGGEA